MSEKVVARRYNSDKLRMELISPIALKELAKVYTTGALKYTTYNEDGSIKDDGANNWHKGLPWMSVIASAERHIAAWKLGEDIDPDLKTKHLANAMWNIAALLHYEVTHPEMDDRPLWYKKPFKKLWLDLDGVLVEFEQYFLNTCGQSTEHPIDLEDFRFRDSKNWDIAMSKPDFWLNAPRLVNPSDIKYPIAGYCTSRSLCDDTIVEAWLRNNGFPKAKIINTKGEAKSKFLLKAGCEVMVDDSIDNFVDCQSHGIPTYLMSRPHNTKYNVGHWRINSLQELFDKLMS